MEQVHLLLRHREIPNIDQYDVYVAHGGYEGLKAALEKSPDAVIDIVKQSGLRGRGGAGFPTGVKWGFVPKDIFPKYLVCNFAEDREIVENNPHQLVEGIIIAAYAIQASTAYIYHRGEFSYAAQQLEKAIADAKAHGWLGENIQGTGFSLNIYLHREAGAYICGEETAQLNSIEGCTEKNPGTRIYGVSGHVVRPGLYELPTNVTARELIFEHAGGSGGVIVIDDHTDMAWLAYKMVAFYRHESCGKCSPCREGTYWQKTLLTRIVSGRGTRTDVELLKQVSDQMTNKCFCPLDIPVVEAGTQ